MKVQEAIENLSGYDGAIMYPTARRDEAIKMAKAALIKQAANNCDGCRFDGREEWEDPCKHCCRLYHDFWRAKR